jgi:hypothetical protein
MGTILEKWVMKSMSYMVSMDRFFFVTWMSIDPGILTMAYNPSRVDGFKGPKSWGKKPMGQLTERERILFPRESKLYYLLIRLRSFPVRVKGNMDLRCATSTL